MNRIRLIAAVASAWLLLGSLLLPGVSAQTGGEGFIRPAPSLDRPIDPDRYLVRPGERLRVTFIDSKLSPVDFLVDAEGRVVDAKIGVHAVGGMTLSHVRTTLLDPLRRLYQAENITISVISVYPVTIRVTGAVSRPGRYMGYTSQTVSELIDSAGGVVPGGSTRYIQFSGGPEIIRVDLEKAGFLGDVDSDPCLYAGQSIDVPTRTGSSVQVVGEVVQPRDIEWVEGDDLQTLVALAGGPTMSADVSGAAILNDPSRDPHVPGQIRPGDVIEIPSGGPDSPGSAITLVGSIVKPGRYAYREDFSITDLIQSAGGFTERANPGRVTVFRRIPTGLVSGRVSSRYPIAAGGNSSGNEIELWPGDSVFVPTQVGFVRVEGLVARPGLYPHHSGWTVSQYVKLAGGYTDLARQDTVEITNRIANTTQMGATSQEVFDGDRIKVLPKEVTQ